MPKARLTDIGVKALKPPSAGQQTYWCAQLPAFGVRVSQGGSKTFVVKKHNRRHTIGRYPTISLHDARMEARRLLLQSAAGPSMQLGELVELFFAVRCTPKNNKPRTIADYKRLLERHFGHLHRKQLSAIAHSEISQILDALSDTPSEANHAYISIKTLFNFALERRIVGVNPCPSGLPYKRGSRDRVLEDAELRAIWNAATDYPFGSIVRLLILTGQRRSEIGALQWSYIGNDVVTLPSTMTKNGLEHRFPLTDCARNLLDRIPRASAYVFPSRDSDSKHFSGWNKCKQRLELSIPHWTLHDLRRTFSTLLARIGTPPHITERILNHQVGTLTPIAKIYNRYSYFDEMREAMCNYEKELQRILSIENT